MKAIEQYFPVMPSVMLYRVVLTFESVDEIRCSISNAKVKYQVVLFLFFLFDIFTCAVVRLRSEGLTGD